MKRSIPYVLLVCLCIAVNVNAESSSPRNDQSIVSEEWRTYIEPLIPIAERLSSHLDDRNDPQQRHQLYEYILSQMSAAYIGLFYADAKHPTWWPVFSPVNDILWPTPDTTYLMTPVDANGVYKISGYRGSVRILTVSAQGGSLLTRGERATVAGGMGKAHNILDIDEQSIDENDYFEVIASQDKPKGYKGDWWEIGPETTYLFLRQVHYDWRNEVNARIAIDRLDTPVRQMQPTVEDLQADLKQLPIWVKNWIDIAYRLSAKEIERGLIHKFDFVDWGAAGFIGQGYLGSAFDLEEDEALIIETEVPDECRYWSFQVVTESWRAVNGVLHQSSLNGHQARIDKDGKFRAVLSTKDPGVPNWLDTAGNKRGRIYARWYKCSSQPVPVATKVELSQLRQHLPNNTPELSKEQRERALRERKEAFQLRGRW